MTSVELEEMVYLGELCSGPLRNVHVTGSAAGSGRMTQGRRAVVPT